MQGDLDVPGIAGAGNELDEFRIARSSAGETERKLVPSAGDAERPIKSPAEAGLVVFA
jgi:hypothetical protein